MFVFAECAAVLDLVCMGDGILILRRLYKQLQSGLGVRPHQLISIHRPNRIDAVRACRYL